MQLQHHVYLSRVNHAPTADICLANTAIRADPVDFGHVLG